MDISTFWEIVERVHKKSQGNMDVKCEELSKELKALSDDDLLSFSDHFCKKNVEAYSWPLWGAAYILGGGCSDDSFLDFMSTLISMGSKTFESALADPNSLANVEFYQNDACYEGYQYALHDVIEARLGEIPPMDPPFPADPSGAEWNEDSLEKLFPSLKYLEG